MCVSILLFRTEPNMAKKLDQFTSCVSDEAAIFSIVTHSDQFVCSPTWRRSKFPFRKRSLPFETVDTISQNGRCHLKRSMPFRKLAEQTTALVNSSYAVGTLGRHFRAVLFTRWQSSNPRARELSQLNQNQPILLVQKQNKNQLRSQRGGTPLCSQLR